MAKDRFRLITAVASASIPILLGLLVLVLGWIALPAILHLGTGFLAGTSWNPTVDAQGALGGAFGALPLIAGTLISSALALALALPIGVAVAVFLAEPTAPGVRAVIGTGVELLAAIPSVVYGIWGLLVLAPFVLDHGINPAAGWLRQHGFNVDTRGTQQTSVLAAGLVLAIMVLPTLAVVSRDVIKAVPGGLREAAVALGSTWWETIRRVVLPAARAGIFGAAVLALGRALGETIAVTLVIGNNGTSMPTSLLRPGYTIASVIANAFGESSGLYRAALVELVLVLLVVVLLINLGAVLLVRRTTGGRR